MKPWMLLLFLFAGGDAFAQTIVRGRVDVTVQQVAVPMSGATVSLCAANQPCTDYVTGPDGMYYFTVNAGDVSIKVNGTEKLRVPVPAQQYFDVDPIKAN